MPGREEVAQRPQIRSDKFRLDNFGMGRATGRQLRGDVLARAIRIAGPSLLIYDHDLADRLTDPRVADAAAASALVVAHAPPGTRTAHPVLESWYAAAPAAQAPPSASAADLCALLYTSGTTGRSKACMLSHWYFTAR